MTKRPGQVLPVAARHDDFCPSLTTSLVGYNRAMTQPEDEARVDRIRAVINALHARGSNSPGVQKELLPAALVSFFLDELRDQFSQVRALLEKQEDDD